MRIVNASVVLAVSFLSGCVTTAPRYSAEPYVPPVERQTGEVTFWADHFRNREDFSIGLVDQSTCASFREVGQFHGNPSSQEKQSFRAALPAQEPLLMRVYVSSSSGFVTKTCAKVYELTLKAGVSYDVEVLSWKDKEALFGEFTCELRIAETSALDARISPPETSNSCGK